MKIYAVGTDWNHFGEYHNIRFLWRNKNKYSKCPKISYTKMSDKMAYTNSADQDQMAFSRAV